MSVKSILKKTILYSLYNNRKALYYEKVGVTKLNNSRKDFVNTFIPKSGVGAELGVLKGHFSPLLLSITKAKKLHLIDPWYMLDSYWSWASGDQSTVNALINILKRFKRDIEEKRITVHVGDDSEVLKNFPDNYFDWVYIDSSHNYEHTKVELKILLQKVKQDGIIAGDDWRPDVTHRHHGVFKAVNEFIVEHNYILIHADESNLQWAITRSK